MRYENDRADGQRKSRAELNTEDRELKARVKASDKEVQELMTRISKSFNGKSRDDEA
jgi:hypothetical protein